HHYVGALGLDAFSEQALVAIRRLHAEHDLTDVLADDPYIGAHLARAYLLADKGEFGQAVTVVAQVDDTLPELGAVELLVDWFDGAPMSDEARGWVVRRLARSAQLGMGRVRLLPGERAAIEPYAKLADRVAKDETKPQVLFALSGLYRRAARYDDAIRVA